MIPPNDREKAFKYLNNRNKETFLLIPPCDRKNAFKYLNEKNKETIKLVPNYEDDPELLKLVGISPKKAESTEKKACKTIEEFKLMKKDERYKYFKDLNEKSLEAFQLIPEYDRCDWEGKPIKFIDEKYINFFKLVPIGRRLIAFKYAHDKDIELFKLIEESERF